MARKITGFSVKEQKLWDVLSDGKPHDIRELKALFIKEARARVKDTYENAGLSEIDSQAQSFVRNSIRRLIRDKWVNGPAQDEELGRGTYQLSKAGKSKIEKKASVTISAEGRKKKVAAKKKRTLKKKAAKKAKAKAKKVTKKAAPKKTTAKKAAKKTTAKKTAPKKVKAKKPEPKKTAKVTPITDAAKIKAKQKAAEAAKRAGQAVAKDKAEARAKAE